MNQGGVNGRSWALKTQWFFDPTFTREGLLGTTISRVTQDRTLMLWDVETGGPRWEAPIPLQASLLVSHDGTWAATWDAEALRCWDLPTGQLLRQTQQRMFVVAALPGDVLLCLGNGSIFALWVRTGQVEKLFEIGATSQVAVNAEGSRLACVAVSPVSGRRELGVWDLVTRARLFGVAAECRETVVFRPGVNELVLPCESRGPLVCDATTGATLAFLPAPETQAWPHVALSPNGRWLATAHGDQRDNHAPYDDLCLRVWDLAARTLHRTHEVDSRGIPGALRISDGAVVDAAHAGDRLWVGRFEG